MKIILRSARASALACAFILALLPAAFAEDILLASLAGPDTKTISSFDDSPRVTCKSAILVDAVTGSVLYQKNADSEIPPASLTKLMTIHLARKAIASGKLSRDSFVPILRQDCALSLPYRSSLMFLEEGMKVTLGELLLGLAVDSGNDAAFAVARELSGNLEDFAKVMTEEARSMGLERTRYAEPSGLSEWNIVTAREFARFCQEYLRQHPGALMELHSQPSLSFPLLANMPEGYKGSERAITQKNRNSLIFEYPGCDGLKTGYIDESGYNIALTAERQGTRLIAVLLGGPGKNSSEGSYIRAVNGRALLDYGFRHFVTARPRLPKIPPARVWKGATASVDIIPSEIAAMTVTKEDVGQVEARIQRDIEIIAPISKGEALGEVVFTSRGKVIRRLPLVAAHDVGKGNFLKVAADSVLLALRGGVRRTEN